ncbi:hypothetical protein QE345_gp107 [Pseudomonas phage vB_PA45_GUMS]|uniref:Uncharacterized protein n=1 Tax=Pseudomonas phage vB_PA45_GUMS TaxID=2656517 RepID=A0A8T8BGK3_9CAUD|nr:hypothetical protein QE345_gp107 [Pseudomonas phage vB_PA45_GUMS]QGK90282.1 hypothetical protein [Pseudomonas phage vB_PA45_GUMS]
MKAVAQFKSEDYASGDSRTATVYEDVYGAHIVSVFGTSLIGIRFDWGPFEDKESAIDAAKSAI